MEKTRLVPSSSSPSSSETDSLNAPSPSISLANPNSPSPTSTYVEQKRDGSRTHGALAHPQEGRLSVSSNSDEEMVRQHVCDIIPDSSHDDVQQAWDDASPIQHGDALGQGSLSGVANLRCGSDDVNASQLGKDTYADAEKGWGFANVKRVDGEEEGQSDCCRVCHLSVEKSPSAGEIMKLGCACKDDLALAHRRCAETWFKIKGNRTCEICGSTAENILGSRDGNFIDQWNDGEVNYLVPRRAERCWQNQPICNTVLVCVILVLIASWLFKVAVF